MCMCGTAVHLHLGITNGLCNKPAIADSSGAFSIVATSVLVAAQCKGLEGSLRKRSLLQSMKERVNAVQHTVRTNL